MRTLLTVLALLAAALVLPAPATAAAPAPGPVLCWPAPSPGSGWTAVGDFDSCAQCETAGQAGIADGDWDRYLCGFFPIGLDGVYKLHLRTPAERTQWDCTFYLGMKGYSGKIVEMGCASGADGNPVLCVGSLRIAGVPDAIAEEACRRAQQP
jgi:hypothetical protein